MGHNNKRRELLLGDRLQRLHDRSGRGRIEVAGRFIGEEELRAVNDRSRDGHALLFASTELMSEVVTAITQFKERQGFACALLTPVPGYALQQEWEHHVLQCAHGRQKIEKLKNDPELMPPVICYRVLVSLVQSETVHTNLTGRRSIQSSDQM